MKIVKVIIIIVVILMFIAYGIFIWQSYRHKNYYSNPEYLPDGKVMTDEEIIKKGNKLYGKKETCICVSYITYSFSSITSWRCDICEKFGEAGSTDIPNLCDTCAEISNRCYECGRLLKQNAN